MKQILLAAIVSCVAVGCTDVARSRITSYGEAHTIKLYSGGQVVATFQSTGKVECTEGGICDFRDDATGKLVRTTGDIVVITK